MLQIKPETSIGSRPGTADLELSARTPRSIAFTTAALFALVTWTANRNLLLGLEAVCILVPPVVGVWLLREFSMGARLVRLSLLPLNDGKASKANDLCWLILGFATILFGVGILETCQPLYFTQDDSLANGVVGMVAGGRSLAKGQFPVWNPSQYLGAPMASMSYWSLTYPPTYVSYFLSKLVIGNEWWTMEVYQVGHLLLSYFALYWAARTVSLRPATASMASVTVALSGTSLIVGRSWYATVPLNFWLPLLVVGICRLRRGPVSWPWILANGTVMGLLFHVGYPQTWVYAMLTFLGCGVLLWWLGDIPFRRVLCVIPAQLIGIAIASPLLVVLLLESQDCQRSTYGHGVDLSALLAMLLPYPVVRAAHPENWGSTDVQLMGQMYYWGTLLPVLALGGMASFIAVRHTRKTLLANYWLVVAASWFAVMLGQKGVLWPVMQRLPGFSRFSCPFKVQQFFILCAALGAGIMLDRLLAKTRARCRWEAVLTSLVFGLMTYHCWMARPSFYSYGFEPYPTLPDEFEPLRASPQRVAVIAPERSIDATYPLSLQLNSATAYGIRALAGYDPLVSATPLMRRVLRTAEHSERGWETYGVRWVVIHRAACQPILSGNQYVHQKEMVPEHRLEAARSQLKRKGATIYYESPAVTVYELPHTEPMAFVTGDTSRSLPLCTHNGGIVVDTTSLTDQESITVNYVRRPFMKARADGAGIDLAHDIYDRVQCFVPRGTREVTIRYSPPWRWGVALGAFLSMTACGLVIGLSRWGRVVRRGE